MSVKRSPPLKIPNLKQQTLLFGSDSQLDATIDKDVQGKNQSPTDYAYSRNKRPREDNTSPSQLASLKEDMKEFMSSLIMDQKKELCEITKNLKEIQHTNTNIEQSISLLALQNEEFRKRIEVMESQAKKVREYISILEEKIEDLQRISRRTSVELKNVPRKNPENRDDLSLFKKPALAKNVTTYTKCKSVSLFIIYF